MYSTNSASRKAVVQFKFDSTEESQLSIAKGEEIELVGEVTAEGWILARKKNGDEGYIPDKYFEVTSSAGRPPRPPPVLPGTSSGGNTSDAPASATSPSSTNVKGAKPAWVSKASSKTSSMMQQGDEYGLFAYQYEWYSIVALYCGGILGFLYSTTLPDEYRVWFILATMLSVVVTTANLVIISSLRDRCSLCGCGTVGIRIALFIVNAALLCATPVGAVCAAVGLVAAVIEAQVIRKKVNDLPEEFLNDWNAQVCGNGGLAHCSLSKLIIFFSVLAVSVASLGYGFSDGYAFAIDTREEVATNYYLNPEVTGLMVGCGRVVTVSLVMILLFSLFGCCARQERNIKARRKEGSACGKLMAVVYSDVESRRYIHRVFGYCIVVASFFHCIFAYYSYEDSSSTHSFYDIYGWYILMTGGICLVLLSVIVASSNDAVRDRAPRLFTVAHRVPNVLLVMFLIFHGSLAGIVGQWFWIFIIAPFSLYLCDALYRYARQDE